jgi:hypothetical protein
VLSKYKIPRLDQGTIARTRTYRGGGRTWQKSRSRRQEAEGLLQGARSRERHMDNG